MQLQAGEKGASMSADMSLVAVEARALPAPGYMGLPNANHIYVVSTDRTFGWPCFGRSHTAGDGSALVTTATIYKEWAFELAEHDSNAQYLGGVANTVNGTCHSIANRILALSTTPDASVAPSADDAYSVVVFGKYGMGTSQFCEILRETFQRVSARYNAPGALLEDVLARVRNPVAEELQAWEAVLRATMQLDVEQLLRSNPALHQQALSVLARYAADRDAMYERCFDYRSGRAPNAAETAAIRSGLATLAWRYVSDVLNALAASGSITNQQRDEIGTRIRAYVEQRPA